MNIETYTAFIIASVVLMLIPGPTVLLVISYALAKGRKIALAVVCGTTIGVLFSMVATLLGVGIILATSETLFVIMKWVGAVYLAWMGWKMIRTAKTVKTEIEKVIEESHFSAFRDSAIVTFLNPKSYGFFVVFVPQFIDSSSPILPQFIIMIVTFVGLGVVNTLAFAMLAAQIRHMITKPDTLVWIQKTGGFTLLAIATYAILVSFFF